MYDPTANIAMRRLDPLYDIPTGKRFEDLMTGMIKDFARDENKVRMKSGSRDLLQIIPYSKEEDEKRGTDIMIKDPSGFFGVDGILRIDITHNFGEKNNMPVTAVDTTMIISHVMQGGTRNKFRFQYGVRTGNLRKNFEVPVAVIGFDMRPKIYEVFERDPVAQSNFHKQIYEILNMANDTLQAFCYAADPSYKKWMNKIVDPDELPDPTLLIPNRTYLKEIGQYLQDKWELPADTKLNSNMLKMLEGMAKDADKWAVNSLRNKYQEQAEFIKGLDAISNSESLNI